MNVDTKNMNAEQAARVFGLSLKGDKWYLAALVAAYVRPAKPGPKTTGPDGKVSASTFAKYAGGSTKKGVATKTVMRYLRAWDKAAEDGMVPPSSKMHPLTDIDEVLQVLVEGWGGTEQTIENVGPLDKWFPKADPKPEVLQPLTDAEVRAEVAEAAMALAAKEAVAEAEEAKEAAEEAGEHADYMAQVADAVAAEAKKAVEYVRATTLGLETLPEPLDDDDREATISALKSLSLRARDLAVELEDYPATTMASAVSQVFASSDLADDDHDCRGPECSRCPEDRPEAESPDDTDFALAGGAS